MYISLYPHTNILTKWTLRIFTWFLISQYDSHPQHSNSIHHSMYGIFADIYLSDPNVGKLSIHGAYGIGCSCQTILSSLREAYIAIWDIANWQILRNTETIDIPEKKAIEGLVQSIYLGGGDQWIINLILNVMSKSWTNIEVRKQDRPRHWTHGGLSQESGHKAKTIRAYENSIAEGQLDWWIETNVDRVLSWMVNHGSRRFPESWGCPNSWMVHRCS